MSARYNFSASRSCIAERAMPSSNLVGFRGLGRLVERESLGLGGREGTSAFYYAGADWATLEYSQSLYERQLWPYSALSTSTKRPANKRPQPCGGMSSCLPASGSGNPRRPLGRRLPPKRRSGVTWNWSGPW